MLLFCDSFDLYTNPAQKYDQAGAGATISKSAARNGTQGLACTPPYAYIQKNFSSRATYYAGFSFFVSSFFPGDSPIPMCALWDSGTSQIEIRISQTGNFQFYRNGTAIGSQSTYSLSFNCWHYIEFNATINSSTGTANLKVDGNFVLQLSGQDTQATSNPSASAVVLGTTSGGAGDLFSTFYYDDFIVMDPTGSYNNTYLGDVRVTAQVPSANGSTNNYTQNAASWAASTAFGLGNQIIDSNGNLQRVSTAGTSKSGSHPTWSTTPLGATTTDGSAVWTLIQVAPLSNYNFVNEVPPDDNDSYLSDATISDEDLYTFPAMSGATVFAAVVNLRAEKDDASTRSVRALAKSSSTTADNGSDFILTENTYFDFEGIFETDPNTSAPWTIAAVNAAQFGIKTTA